MARRLNGTVKYRIPDGVRPLSVQHRPVLSTPQGGRVALDTTLLSLWRSADGRQLEEIIAHFRGLGHSEVTVRAALACLAQAGLLVREGESRAVPDDAPESGDLVSAVIVSYNSREWLEECISALVCQTYTPIEILVVDNGSSDGSADWLQAHYPSMRLVRLPKALSLAGALNKGVSAANGQYLLVLNPDARLERGAVARMVAVAREDTACAAVAPKLRFSWAPPFLNGLGNYAGAFSWGTDAGLGHLDLAQFDHWKAVSSACFAAALIRREAWDKIGPLDEGFPLYYEDLEWSYRARLFGYAVQPAPEAIVYHALGIRSPSGSEGRLGPDKLRNVVYGRLRFAAKLLGFGMVIRFLTAYLIEDAMGLLGAAVRGRWGKARAYWQAWSRFRQELAGILGARRLIQAQRSISDTDLLSLQKQAPAPFVWHGLPELTWDLVSTNYLPVLLDKKGGVPELAAFQARIEYPGRLARAFRILRADGLSMLSHRILRYLHWFASQP